MKEFLQGSGGPIVPWCELGGGVIFGVHGLPASHLPQREEHELDLIQHSPPRQPPLCRASLHNYKGLPSVSAKG